MAISLNQIKQRGNQISTKQGSSGAGNPKKRSLAPWEEVTLQDSPISKTILPPEHIPVALAVEPKIGPIEATLRSPEPTSVQATNHYQHGTPQALESVAAKDTEVKLETTEDNVQVKRAEEISSTRAKSRIPVKATPVALPTKIEREQSLEFYNPTDVSFSQISGIQRKLVIYVFKDCLNRGSLESSPLSIEHLSQSLTVAYHSIKKSVDRLQKRSILERAKFKNGRGGWTQYRIALPVYQELTRLSRDGLLPEIDSPDEIRTLVQKLETTRDDRHVRPQNDEPQYQDLPSGWEGIDFDSLSNIGFSKHHLKQVATQGKLSPQEVQDSINFFSFDLNSNGKLKDIKGEPLNYFMGIVRKGRPYVPPSNYLSPEDQERRKYLESKRRIEERRVAEEREIKDLEFASWRSSLSATSINDIVPEFARRSGPLQDGALRSHFDDKIWPELRLISLPADRQAMAREIQHQIEVSLSTPQSL